MTVLALTDPVNGTVVDADLIADNNAALRTVVNGQLDAGNVTTASLTDATLASPNNSVYKTVMRSAAFVVSGQANNTYLFGSDGGSLLISGVGIAASPHLFYFDSTDLTVAGKTLSFRVRVLYSTNNSAAPAATFTFGLYPVLSSSGGASAINITLDAVVAGSTIAVVTPGTGTVTNAVGTAFTPPPTGALALGVVVTGGPTAPNSYGNAHAVLQYRHI